MKKSYHTHLWTVVGVAVVSMLLVPPAEATDTWSKKIDKPARFVILKEFNEEAVLDRETQLVWQREPKDQPDVSFYRTDFFGAVRHCYSVTTGDRMGWRLPTAEELTSLLVETPTQSSVQRAALPHRHPFIGIAPTRVWTISEGSFDSAPGRYVVAPNEPEVSTVGLELDLEAIHSTWCVRGQGGGQSTREP